MSNPTRPLSSYVGRSLGKITAYVLAAIVALMLNATHTEPDLAPAPAPIGSPESVLDRMGDRCWSGPAPADVDLPGHVVYSKPNGPTRVGGPHLVGLALDQIFNGADHDLTVHAFCR